jgi:hypothetical protein
LYAQVLYELREQKAPYWFDNLEVERIQELNLDFMEQKDMAELINACFRKPEEGESPVTMDSTQMLKLIQVEYPSMKINQSARVCLGRAMKELGFAHTSCKNVAHYKVIPLIAA